MAELNSYRCFMCKEEMHKSLNTLCGILSGVAANGIISESEYNEVKNWYSLHADLLDLHPFSEILPQINSALSDGVLDTEEVDEILWLCSKFINDHGNQLYFDLITSQIQFLEGALHGIIADGEIDDTELQKLNDWLNDHDYLSGVYPYDEVYSLLLAAKEDGKISQDERNMLKAFFANFVDTRESCNIHDNDIKALQEQYSVSGICAICPEIIFPGKVFSFTGVSKKATRQEIAEKIESMGGIFSNSVTKKTDYLIIGADGNPCWAFSCYGRKVEKAVDLRKHGSSIILVHEYDFWDELG